MRVLYRDDLQLFGVGNIEDSKGEMTQGPVSHLVSWKKAGKTSRTDIRRSGKQIAGGAQLSYKFSRNRWRHVLLIMPDCVVYIRGSTRPHNNA